METVLPTLSVPMLGIEEINKNKTIDLEALFPNYRDLWLEVGFGGGEHLAWQAAHTPEVAMIGAEPFINGVAKLLSQIDDQQLKNIRIHHGDARPASGR